MGVVLLKQHSCFCTNPVIKSAPKGVHSKKDASSFQFATAAAAGPKFHDDDIVYISLALCLKVKKAHNLNLDA